MRGGNWKNTPAARARRRRNYEIIRQGGNPYGEPEDYLAGAGTLNERIRRLKILQRMREKQCQTTTGLPVSKLSQ
jgi:hypothetical protein